MKKKKEELCPRCGAKLPIANSGLTIIATFIGNDSDVCSQCPEQFGMRAQRTATQTAKERIEALRKAGVDVSNLFAMQGANGREYIASDENGTPTILEDDHPIFAHISNQGTVPNRTLFRRYVMAQMFHMLSYVPYGQKDPIGVTGMIHRLGYEYQWKMLLNELNAQEKMEDKDFQNFIDRNRWFNVSVVVALAEDYIEKLKERVNALPDKHCKKIPYKRIGSRDIFVSDLNYKLYSPLWQAVRRIQQAKNAAQLYNAAKKFNDMRLKMPSDTPQCQAWIAAYKGSGAFFTMQNLIRFHDCVVIDDAGYRLDKSRSLAFLAGKAELYKGEGWRLLAVLKKMLKDNNINIKKKMTEWRKRK